ncbi:MAG TPA: sugar phosphate isomerase/epimerase, partial [Schlesneria sp.]
MTLQLSRRGFLSASAGLLATATASSMTRGLLADDGKAPLYKISLAQWSLHRTFFEKKADPLDFAKISKTEFGIDGIEYVNQFFKDKATDTKYLGELKKRADDHGVTSVLIMCDGEGALGDPDEKRRLEAVDNHK